MVAYNFNAAEFDPSQGVEIWPDNTWVKVIAEKHDTRPIRGDEKQGRLLWTLRAVEGPLQGKVQFLGMNLWIESEQGRQMAQRELSAMTYVTLGAAQGRLNWSDFSELQNIPFYILSKHGFNDRTKATSQDWGGFKDVNGNDPGKQGGGAPAAAPGFGAPAAGAPAPAPAFGQPQQQAAPGFAPGGAPAAAPGGFAPQQAPVQQQAPAPGFGAPPPAQAAPPAFGQPQQAPAAAPGFAAPGGFPAPQQAPAAAPGGFAPPNGQAPAGNPPWQR